MVMMLSFRRLAPLRVVEGGLDVRRAHAGRLDQAGSVGAGRRLLIAAYLLVLLSLDLWVMMGAASAVLRESVAAVGPAPLVMVVLVEARLELVEDLPEEGDESGGETGADELLVAAGGQLRGAEVLKLLPGLWEVRILVLGVMPVLAQLLPQEGGDAHVDAIVGRVSGSAPVAAGPV